MSTPICRVLVIDDTADNRLILRDVLTAKGFEVSQAENGKSGFQQSQLIIPDIILMDLNMPDMLGIDVCRMVRESAKTKHVPIIMVTGSDVSSRDKVWGFRSGADDYLVRPFDIEELVE